MPSKDITKQKLIGLVDCIVESHLNGTAKTDMSISPCQVTLKNNYKSLKKFANRTISGLFIPSTNQEIWKRHARFHPRRHHQRIFQRQEKTGPISSWNHTVLCQGSQHHTTHGTQHYWSQIIRSYRIHFGRNQTTSLLLCNAPKGKR